MKQINIKEYFNQEIDKLRELTVKAPSLLIIDATSGDSANQIYIRNKLKDFGNLGWKADVAKVKSSTGLRVAINQAKSRGFTGVIVQMPVASGINFSYDMIPVSMDCDGLHPQSKVIPATVRGIIDYLDKSEFDYERGFATILGRSDIVGKPMAKALLDKNMTVAVCHSRTTDRDRENLLRQSNLVISAVGRPDFLHRDECPNAYVVDVGINRNQEGKIVGDFVETKSPIFSTPVPGGVGLLTRLGLMKNCIDLL